MRELLGAAVFGVSVVLSACLVPVSRVTAGRLGVVDRPGVRKVHAEPMPRLGGVAIFGAFMAVVLSGYLSIPSLRSLGPLSTLLEPAVAVLSEAWRVRSQIVGLAVGAVVAFTVGVLDDVYGARFPVWAKLFGQALAAAIVVASGVRTSFAPFEWMNVAITLVWIVGITNAFNLLDNMDGLAAGVALIASAVLLLNAWSLGEFFISLMLLAFMGSLAGFLFFNFAPASVFMGDCGSLFIGFVLATVTLLESYVPKASSTLFPVLMPVLVLALPIVDTATVTVIRLREGRPIYVGDKRHLSHRLVALGFTPRAAVLVIYLITLALGLGATSLADASPSRSVLVLVQSLVFIALVLILMFLPSRAPLEVNS